MFKVLHNKSAVRTLKYTIIQAIRKADWDISTPADFPSLAEDCKDSFLSKLAQDLFLLLVTVTGVQPGWRSLPSHPADIT